MDPMSEEIHTFRPRTRCWGRGKSYPSDGNFGAEFTDFVPLYGVTLKRCDDDDRLSKPEPFFLLI